MGISVYLRRTVAAALGLAAFGAASLYAQNGSMVDAVENARRARSPGDVRADVFATPRPKPAARARHKAPAAVPQPPSPPPFPYKYGGRLDDRSGTIAVYLRKGTELIAIKRGDVLEGGWKIEALSTEHIEVSFVPGGQQLSMLLASLTGETGVPAGAFPSPATLTAQSPASSAPPASASSAAAQSAPSTGPLVGGTVPAAPASPRASFAAVARAGSLPAQASSAGPEASSALPTGKLGFDAPMSGSMPTGPAPTGTAMQIGPAPSGSLPTSPPPAGKLGL
jgi:hypothetical protein